MAYVFVGIGCLVLGALITYVYVAYLFSKAWRR